MRFQLPGNMLHFQLLRLRGINLPPATPTFCNRALHHENETCTPAQRRCRAASEALFGGAAWDQEYCDNNRNTVDQSHLFRTAAGLRAQRGFETWLDIGPGAHVLGLFLAPHHLRICIPANYLKTRGVCSAGVMPWCADGSASPSGLCSVADSVCKLLKDGSASPCLPPSM